MDNSVEDTICELEKLGVLVKESFKINNPCLSLEGGRLTCFNPKLLVTSTEQRTALLHECWHFTSGAFYQPYSSFVLREQAEYRANKTAILKYIPEPEIDECASQGVMELWEFAEHFDVTEDFMFKALLFYQEKRFAG